MQIMMFSEGSIPKYDLMLMDLRLREDENKLVNPKSDDYVAKIIWRKYTQLPQIPLVAEYTRNTAASIERIQVLEENMTQLKQDALNQFKADLLEIGMRCQENTSGYALQWIKSRKSTYININIEEQGWTIMRHQIRRIKTDSNLFDEITVRKKNAALESIKYSQEEKASSLGEGYMYHITICPEYPFDSQPYVEAVKVLALKSE